MYSPPLVILSIFGLQNISKQIRVFCPKKCNLMPMLLSLIIPCTIVVYNSKYIIEQFRIVQPISYLQGYVNKDQYISRFYPEYSVIQHANKILLKSSKVLCLYLGNRGYYINFVPIFDKPTRTGLTKEILSLSKRGSDIKTELHKQNINHILLRNDLTENWLNHLSKQEQAIITSFFRHNTKVLLNNGHYSFLLIK